MWGPAMASNSTPTTTSKRVTCNGPYCAQRRVHHEDQFTMRGKPVEFDAPADAVGPFFCSLECWAYWKSSQRRNPKGEVLNG